MCMPDIVLPTKDLSKALKLKKVKKKKKQIKYEVIRDPSILLEPVNLNEIIVFPVGRRTIHLLVSIDYLHLCMQEKAAHKISLKDESSKLTTFGDGIFTIHFC